jgi:predicted Rossmann fold flavoprotein
MPPTDHPPVIVIGAGAAGMLAAGSAAEAGARVLLLEKMKRPGIKLAITGKGRCNLTNNAAINQFLERFGPNGRFLRQALQAFDNHALINFFNDLGLATKSERGGRVFPASDSAPEVVRVLCHWLERLGVQLECNRPVSRLITSGSRITAVASGPHRYPAGAVILTTGGASYPATGSTGDGWQLLRPLGHTLIPPRPALVPLVSSSPLPHHPAGLNLRNVKVRLKIDGKKRREEFGELTFTPDGVGGPTILTLSETAASASRAGREVVIVIDLKPALDETRLDRRLQRDLTKRSRENLASILRGLMPRELVATALALNRLDPERKGAQITAAERRRLKTWLKDFRIPIAGARPLAEALVTAGGVALKEVDPRTLASRKIANLFLAGEILDLAADTGGYNLQAAFSTGRLAGRTAALPQTGKI